MQNLSFPDSARDISAATTRDRRGTAVSSFGLAAIAVVLATGAGVALWRGLLDDPSAASLAPASYLAWVCLPIAGICAAIGVVSWRRHRHLLRRLEQIAGSEPAAAARNDALTGVERRLAALATMNEQLGALLLDRDRQLAALRSQAAAIYWETDATGRYSRLELASGAQRGEMLRLLGRHRWDDEAQVTGGALADWPALRERLRRGEPFDGLVVRRRAHGGGWFETWEAGEPRYGADGSPLGYHGVMIDLDLAPPTRVVRDASAVRLEALEASTRELESFSYTVSHDLRAPLRTIEGFARIVQEDYEGVLDHAAREHLGRILAASQRMNGMIEALLSLARLSGQPVTAVDVDLSRLADELIEELRAHERHDAPSEDPGRARRVSVRITPALRDRGDPALLRLVLQNLLGNAWKYSSRRPHATIALTREKHGRQDVYCVSDNGVGFDMRHADRLFGAFQRLHGASEFPGTGIGLATAQRIVRRHEGRLWAYAEPDRGASFYFTLWERRPPSWH